MSPRSPPDWDLGEAPQFAPPRLGSPQFWLPIWGTDPPDRNLGENCVVEVGNPSQSGGRTPRSQSGGELGGRTGECIPIWGIPRNAVFGGVYGITGWRFASTNCRPNDDNVWGRYIPITPHRSCCWVCFMDCNALKGSGAPRKKGDILSVSKTGLFVQI